MQFVQIVQMQTSKFDEMRAAVDEWQKATEGKRTLQRSVVCEDRDRPGRYFVIAFFNSYEDAAKNSGLPETDALATKTAALSDEPPSFYNLDVIEEISKSSLFYDAAEWSVSATWSRKKQTRKRKTMPDTFPEFIKALPRPDTQFTIDAHIVPSEHALTMFYSVEVDTVVPMHSHGPQWGVVLAGTVEMEAGGVVSRYGPGDTYYIAEGVPHEARISGGCTGIDVFADAHRYEPAP